MCALVEILLLQKALYVSICIVRLFPLACIDRHASFRHWRWHAIFVLTGAMIMVRARGGMRLLFSLEL